MENTTQTFFLNVVVFIGAVIFSLISNQVLLRLIRTSATKSISPEMIRWNTAKPAVGGISFFMTFLLSFTIAGIIFQGDSIFKSYFHLSLIATCSMAFLMGLADDAYNTKPWLKFLVQFACGLFLIVFNQHIKIFDNEWLNYTITMVWVIGIMNSINMLDNMDAITTSVSAFILLNALALLYVSGRANEVVFVILLGLLGALVGFLFFNWHPSKLYMGDTGSQFLGMLIGIVGIKFFWNAFPSAEGVSSLKPLVAVALVFLLPLIDTTTVTINRLRRKQSPFVGGRDHTTHCLVYAGLSDSRVAFVFLGISLISFFLNLSLFFLVDDLTWGIFALYLTYCLAIFSVLFALSLKYWHKYAHQK